MIIIFTHKHVSVISQQLSTNGPVSECTNAPMHRFGGALPCLEPQYAYVCIYIYICIYIYVYIYIYINLCMCMYIYIYIHIII